MLKPIAQAGESVPYGTPVILKGEAKATVTLTVEDISQFYDFTNGQLSNSEIVKLSNLLVGTYPGKTLAAGEGYYMRATTSSEYVYRATSNVALPAFSCYLPSAEKRTYFKLVEEEFTSIRVIDNGQLMIDKDDAIYDLSGRKVSSQPMKGIYIKNGRKQVVK